MADKRLKAVWVILLAQFVLLHGFGPPMNTLIVAFAAIRCSWWYAALSATVWLLMFTYTDIRHPQSMTAVWALCVVAIGEAVREIRGGLA